jgi:hypothetical protein
MQTDAPASCAAIARLMQSVLFPLPPFCVTKVTAFMRQSSSQRLRTPAAASRRGGILGSVDRRNLRSRDAEIPDVAEHG